VELLKTNYGVSYLFREYHDSHNILTVTESCKSGSLWILRGIFLFDDYTAADFNLAYKL